MNRIKKIILGSFVIIFALSYTSLDYVYGLYNQPGNSSYLSEENEKMRIKEVVEKFISNSFNFDISDFDTSLIDPESKDFLKFFNLRNEHRKYMLSTVGAYEYNTKHICKKFDYSTIKITNDVAFVDVLEFGESYYGDDPEPGTGTFGYQLLLRKIDGNWYVHACDSDDDVTNQYDAMVTLDDLVDFSLVDSKSKSNKKSGARIDIDKLKKDVDDYLNEKPDVNMDNDVGYSELPKRKKENFLDMSIDMLWFNTLKLMRTNITLNISLLKPIVLTLHPKFYIMAVLLEEGEQSWMESSSFGI